MPKMVDLSPQKVYSFEMTLQRYNKKLTYANTSILICKFIIKPIPLTFEN